MLRRLKSAFQPAVQPEKKVSINRNKKVEDLCTKIRRDLNSLKILIATENIPLNASDIIKTKARINKNLFLLIGKIEKYRQKEKLDRTFIEAEYAKLSKEIISLLETEGAVDKLTDKFCKTTVSKLKRVPFEDFDIYVGLLPPVPNGLIVEETEVQGPIQFLSANDSLIDSPPPLVSTTSMLPFDGLFDQEDDMYKPRHNRINTFDCELFLKNEKAKGRHQPGKEKKTHPKHKTTVSGDFSATKFDKDLELQMLFMAEGINKDRYKQTNEGKLTKLNALADQLIRARDLPNTIPNLIKVQLLETRLKRLVLRYEKENVFKRSKKFEGDKWIVTYANDKFWKFCDEALAGNKKIDVPRTWGTSGAGQLTIGSPVSPLSSLPSSPAFPAKESDDLCDFLTDGRNPIYAAMAKAREKEGTTLESKKIISPESPSLSLSPFSETAGGPDIVTSTSPTPAKRYSLRTFDHVPTATPTLVLDPPATPIELQGPTIPTPESLRGFQRTIV